MKPFYLHEGEKLAIESISFHSDGTLRGIRVFQSKSKIPKTVINTGESPLKHVPFNNGSWVDTELGDHIILEEDN